MHIELVITSVIQSCVQYPELQELVDRQFCETGDSSLARRLVLKVILEGEGNGKHKRDWCYVCNGRCSQIVLKVRNQKTAGAWKTSYVKQRPQWNFSWYDWAGIGITVLQITPSEFCSGTHRGPYPEALLCSCGELEALQVITSKRSTDWTSIVCSR